MGCRNEAKQHVRGAETSLVVAGVSVKLSMYRKQMAHMTETGAARFTEINSIRSHSIKYCSHVCVVDGQEAHLADIERVCSPFKVTDFGTNRKSVCDRLPISKLLYIIGKICAFERRGTVIAGSSSLSVSGLSSRLCVGLWYHSLTFSCLV